MNFWVFILLVLSTFAASHPTGSYVVHGKRDADPVGMQRVSRAPKDVPLAVQIMLKQQNLEHGARFVQDISDPDSPNFGNHWTLEAVNKKFEPLPVTINTTLDWVHAAGIEKSRTKLSYDRTEIMFSATVNEIEELLQTEYHVFQDDQSGGYQIACDAYSLPEHVQEHVDSIAPTIQLVRSHPGALARTAANFPATYDHTPAPGEPEDVPNCGKLFTIQCLRELYGVPVASLNHTGNELGILSLSNYLWLPDLKDFFRNYTSPQIPPDVEPEFVSIDGGKRGNRSDIEAGKGRESALDVQTAYSIIYPQQVRLYQIDNTPAARAAGSGFKALLNALDSSNCSPPGDDRQYPTSYYIPAVDEGGKTGNMQCGGAPLSHVISYSYGFVESEWSPRDLRRQCHEYMKLNLQGVSIIAGSGDEGVGSSCTKFKAFFPCTCPHVTCVGATALQDDTIAGGEMAAIFNDGSFTSGGGFSNVFDRPPWQDDAVSGYIDKFAPPYGQEVYNRRGRAYPDVSANGWNRPVVILNATVPTGGTSASAPTFAGLINMLNEERLKAGKRPIGHLNYIIYKYPEMFNDIVIGNNLGCGTDGFPASPGWDPVTGHGTPWYPKMREVFLALK